VFFWANFHNLTNIFKNKQMIVPTSGWGNKNSNKMQIGKDTFLFILILRNWLNMFQFETFSQKDNIWILKLLYLNQFTWITVTFEKTIKFGKCLIIFHFSATRTTWMMAHPIWNQKVCTSVRQFSFFFWKPPIWFWFSQTF